MWLNGPRRNLRTGRITRSEGEEIDIRSLDSNPSEAILLISAGTAHSYTYKGLALLNDDACPSRRLDLTCRPIDDHVRVANSQATKERCRLTSHEVYKPQTPPPESKPTYPIHRTGKPSHRSSTTQLEHGKTSEEPRLPTIVTGRIIFLTQADDTARKARTEP
jgi:hypothetical protein